MAGHAYTAAAGRGVTRRGDEPGPAAPMLLAGACLVALAFVWTIAELVPAGRVRDAALLGDFIRQNSAPREEVADFLVHLLEPGRFVIWAAIVVAVALVRQKAWLAVAVAAAMGLAPLTAEILKPMLARSHLGAGAYEVGAASWPSGHATAAGVLVLCAVLVAPPRARPDRRGDRRPVCAFRRGLAGGARVAHAERCCRRAPGGDALDLAGARRGPGAHQPRGSSAPA